jgi:hypothetical protein
LRVFAGPPAGGGAGAAGGTAGTRRDSFTGCFGIRDELIDSFAGCLGMRDEEIFFAWGSPSDEGRQAAQ